MPALILLSGPLSGQRIEVDREIVIGREGVDLVLEDPEISRRHVAVRPRDGGVEVEDLGSRNGTRVDGTPVGAPITLTRDANIELGGTKIQVAVGAAQEAATQVAQAAAPAAAPAAPAADPNATVVGQSPAAPSPSFQKDPEPTPVAAAPPPPQAAPAPPPPPQAPPPQAAPQAPPPQAAPAPPPPQAAPPIPQGAPPGAQYAPPQQGFAPVQAPQGSPFGGGAGPNAGRPPGKRRRGTASRLASGVMFTFFMVGGTTAGLIIYFLTREGG